MNTLTGLVFSLRVVVLPKLVPVRIIPRQTPPPIARPQPTPIRIQQPTNPLIAHLTRLRLIRVLPFQKRRRAHQRRLEVDVDALPHALRRLENLVHESDVLVRRQRLVPPPPGFGVHGSMGVRVDVLDGSPVRDGHVFRGAVGIFADELSHAQEATFLTHGIIQLVSHSFKELIHSLVIGAEDAQRMVGLRTQDQNRYFLLARPLKGAVLIEDLGRGFLPDDVFEVRVGFVAFCDEDHVDDMDGEEDDGWRESVFLGEDEHEEDLDTGAN